MKFYYLGFAIFNDMSLVQDAVVPFNGAEECYVLSHNIIGSDDQIVSLHSIPKPKFTQVLKNECAKNKLTFPSH